MQQLTGMDASFLALETANTTGHVGGLSVLDPSGAPKPLTLARLTEVMAERVALVPVLRCKLLDVPFVQSGAHGRHHAPFPSLNISTSSLPPIHRQCASAWRFDPHTPIANPATMVIRTSVVTATSL